MPQTGDILLIIFINCSLMWCKCPEKVAKWCWKQQNEHNLMYIYHKQCEKGKQINESAQTAEFNVLSRLRKELCAENPKTKENKKKLNVNYSNFSNTIQGCTMSKSVPRAFQKCGTFRYLKVLNQSYWLSKSGQI